MDFFHCCITIVSCKGAMTTHQRPSFELKLHRNAWAVRVSLACWESLQYSPKPTSSIKGPYF